MSKHRLYHGLPVIFNKDHWVIISPNMDKMVHVEERLLEGDKLYSDLQKLGFYEYQNDKDDDTYHIVLITTSDCNLRCRYCFANSGEHSCVMSDDMALAAVRVGLKRAKGKTLSIAFFGGEPTLTQRLIKLIVNFVETKKEGAGVKEIQFGITTNGVTSEEFVEYLIAKKFKITLSADGPAEIQDYHRPFKSGAKTSEIVEKNISRLTKAKVGLLIRATVTKYSVKKMVNAVEWIGDLNGKEIHFEPISISGRAVLKTKGQGLIRPSVEEFVSNLKKAIKKGNEIGVRVANSSFMNLNNPPQSFCDGNINRRFAISFTGDITTCVEVQEKCHPAFNSFVVGYYDRKKKEIVFERQNRIRACTDICSKVQKVQKKCFSCFAKTLCGGGCPVRNYHMTGDSSVVDPYRCAIIRKMVPFVIQEIDNNS